MNCRPIREPVFKLWIDFYPEEYGQTVVDLVYSWQLRQTVYLPANYIWSVTPLYTILDFYTLIGRKLTFKAGFSLIWTKVIHLSLRVHTKCICIQFNNKICRLNTLLKVLVPTANAIVPLHLVKERTLHWKYREPHRLIWLGLCFFENEAYLYFYIPGQEYS